METCVEEMNNCESFLQYKKKHSLKNRIWDIVKDWFSVRNIIIFVLLFVAIILLIMLLQYPESTSTKRIEDVIIVFIVSLLLRLIPSEK